jgi:spore coat polysaccharide biosynthesis protein SpsF
MQRAVRIVIQARMGSQRLPGKTLADVAGQPLLARVVAALQAASDRAGGRWQVVVATSTAAADEPIGRLCRQRAIDCFRGSQHDVLARYVAVTADLADHDIVVRATADNPLYCPTRAVQIVDVHAGNQADYTCVENLSYVVPEVIRVGALRAMAQRGDLDAACREHVTPYFRRAACPFRAVQLPPTWEGLRPNVRLTVDTPEELARMRTIFRELSHELPPFPLQRAYELYDRRMDSRYEVQGLGV